VRSAGRSPILAQLEQRRLNRVRAGLLLVAPKLEAFWKIERRPTT
jgi:hypothetical protein